MTVAVTHSDIRVSETANPYFREDFLGFFRGFTYVGARTRAADGMRSACGFYRLLGDRSKIARVLRTRSPNFFVVRRESSKDLVWNLYCCLYL